MGHLFSILIIISVVTALMQGNAAAVTDAVLSSGEKAVEFTLTMGAAIIVYSGLMNVANRAGLCQFLSKFLAPILTKLFGPLDRSTMTDITMNISCNFLGLGNAATPYGIRAIKSMACGDTATNAMILFVVINTSSVQLLPTTLAAVRQSVGSTSPFDILPCIWICSVLSLLAAVISCKICERFGRKFAKLHNAGARRLDSNSGNNKTRQHF